MDICRNRPLDLLLTGPCPPLTCRRQVRKLKTRFYIFFILFLMAISLSSGCCLFPRSPKSYRFANTASFNGKYENILAAVADVVKEKGFKIWEIDESSGILTTHRSIINPYYYYGFFSHNDEGYCDCGAPALEWVYSGKTAQLNILLIPTEQTDSWRITIDSKFYTTKTYDQINPIWQPPLETTKSEVSCKSTGKLEKEIFDSLFLLLNKFQ